MLLRKMIRDMRAEKTQFLSVMFMLFIGLFVFGGMSAAGDGMQKSSAYYYEQANLADAMIYGAGIEKEYFQGLIRHTDVKRAEQRAQVSAKVSGMKDVLLTLNIIEEGKISRPLRMDGKPYSAKQKGVWLDSMFAKAHKLKTGEYIKIQTPSGEIELEIAGLVMQPEYIYAVQDESQILPDHKKYGYAFLSGTQYPQLTDQSTGSAYSQILIDGQVKKEALEAYADKYLTGKHTLIIKQDKFPGQAMFASEIEQQKAIRFLFPIVFLLIALLTMITALIRMMARQRVQIGTLKAVGVIEWKIYMHYLLYGMLPAIVGGVTGAVLGVIFLPKLMFYFQSQFYAMPEWRRSISASIYIAVILCIAVCAIAAYIACRKELNQAAADILRPKMPMRIKAGRAEQNQLWQKVPFQIRWNVRDIVRNKMRSFITAAGVAGCMMLVLCAFGLKNTIDELIVWMYEDICRYETKVVLKADDSDEKREGQFVQEGQVQIKANGMEEIQNVTVAEQGELLRYTDKNRNITALKDAGAAITYKTAVKLGINEGDTIRWRASGSDSYKSSKITAVIRSPLVQGLYFSKKAYEAEGLEMKPTAFLSDKSADQFVKSQYQSVQSKHDIINDMNTMMQTMNAIIGILIAAAVLLGIVVLYNLGVLAFAEKEKDLTTLQVLGFEDRKLKRILEAQNRWLTIAGILAGIPLGVILLSYLLQYMGDTMDMIPVIYKATYFVSIAGIVLLSTIINHFVSRKINKIRMV